MLRNEIPIRIYSFSCGLLLTQILVFLSKGLLLAILGCCFTYFQSTLYLVWDVGFLWSKCPAYNGYSLYSVVEPTPSFISYGTLPSFVLLSFLLLGGGSGIGCRVSITSPYPLLSESLRGNCILVLFLYCGLKNSFSDISLVLTFSFCTFTGYAQLSNALPPYLSLPDNIILPRNDFRL